MKIKNLKPEQLKQINSKIKENLDLKDLHKHFIDNYKNISFKNFENQFIKYILNGFDDENLKIFDDYNFNQNEYFYSLELFKEEIKNTDTDVLINFKDDDEKFYNSENLDYDYIIDDFKSSLNQKELNFIENRNNDLILKIEGINSILNDLEPYTFKEFLNDLDNLVYDYDLNNMYLMFINDNHKFNFKINLDFEKLNNDIQKDIKKELKIREKSIFKNLKFIKTELKTLINYKPDYYKKEFLKRFKKSYDIDLNNLLENNKTELYEISKFLNPKLVKTEIQV